MRQRSIIGCILAAFLLAVAAPAEVVVTPTAPVGNRDIVVYLRAEPGQPSCLSWRLLPIEEFTVRFVGTLIPEGGLCGDSGILLPAGLAPGRYHVDARLADGTPFGEVYFTKFAEPLGVTASEIAIRPPRPRSDQPVDLILSAVEQPPCFSYVGVRDATITGDVIAVRMNVSYLPFECPPSIPQSHGFVVRLPALTPGLKTVSIAPVGEPPLERRFTVVDAAAPVRLAGRFEITLDWTDPGGSVRHASVDRLSTSAAIFGFGDTRNVELTVKALDGRTLNRKFWIFAASLTDQPWRLRVVDRGSTGCATGHCAERTYSGVAHHNANVLDTRAFDP